MSPTWSICVFAHNEASLIDASLDSVSRALGERSALIHVVANGSTDATPERVAARLDAEPRLRLHRLALGDKANAWNHYVHVAAAREASLHAFVDGDTTIGAGALAAFERCAARHPGALVLAGVSKGGRGDARVAANQMRHNELAGCLYAMPGDAIEMVRRTRFRLPVGLIGDDSLLCWLAKQRWDPRAGRFDESALAQCPDANFRFGKTQYWRPDLLWEHVKRQRRYALRQLQIDALLPVLRVHGVAAMPTHVMELFSTPASAPWPPERANDPFHWWATRELRRAILRRRGRGDGPVTP